MKEERPLDYCKQISPTSQFVLYTSVVKVKIHIMLSLKNLLHKPCLKEFPFIPLKYD